MQTAEDMIMINAQENLFTVIKNLSYKVDSVARYIQNDFSRMLDDGTTTVETIKDEIDDMSDEYDNLIKYLNHCRNESIKIMEYYCK